MKKVILRKFNILILGFPLGWLLLFIASKSVYFAEVIYARHIFKFISVVLSFITGKIPFSIAEWLTPAAIILAAVWFVGFIIHLIKKKGERLVTLVSGVLVILSVGGGVYLGYALGCGINYYRVPLSYQLGVDVHESSVDELEQLVIKLADRASALRAELPEDEYGVYTIEGDTRGLGKSAAIAIEKVSEKYPAIVCTGARPKCMVFSEFMSYCTLTGIYTCYTMEANVNVHCSDYDIGETMCHELSHLSGFIKEDEANCISYLACSMSDDIRLQYSGTVMALIYSGNALYAKSPERYGRAMSHYSDAIWRDFIANNEYWKKYEKTKISEVSDKANDTYLKANNQEDGVYSYGRVVDLLLALLRAGEL